MSTLAAAPPAEFDSVVSANLAKFGRRVYICSLHYMPRNMTRDYYSRLNAGAWTRYNLAAVPTPKSRPSVCVVLDGYQQAFIGSNPDTLRKQYGNTEWPALDIARDLVNEASGGPPSGPDDISRPAIWISQCGTLSAVQQGAAVGLMPGVATNASGDAVYSKEWDTWGTPEFAKQFPEFAKECEAFLQRQWGFSDGMVRRGDALSDGPEKDPRSINEIHRLGASWISASQAEHLWMAPNSFGEMAACPFCGAKTSTKAPKCQNCHEVINKAEYDRLRAMLAGQQQQPPAQGPQQPPAGAAKS